MNFLYSLDLKNIFEGSIGGIAVAVYAVAFTWILKLVKRFKVRSLRWSLPRQASLAERVVRAKQLLDGRSVLTFKVDTLLASLGLSAIVCAVFLYVRLSAMILTISNPPFAMLLEAASLGLALLGSILVSLLIINVARVSATLADFRALDKAKKAALLQGVGSGGLKETAASKR